MLIYFRLSSEHAGAYRECPIATSTITVGELKQLLARRCGFAAEYKRKIDFRVFLVSNNTTKTKTDQIEGDGVEDLVEVEHEDQQVQGFSRVVLQRTVVRGQTCQDVLQHNARTQLTADEWASAEGRQGGGKKRRLPPEWICGLCHGLMRLPLLVKCASNCGHSACRSCIEARLKEQHACPFCRSPFRQVIRNKRLEEILKNINPDEYEQPVGGQRPQSGDVSDTRIPTPAGGASQQSHPKPHEGPPAAPNTGIQEGPLFASTALAVKGETGADTVSNGWGIARAPNKGPSYPALAPRSGPRHFVYLQPQKNLQLMRHFDMMVVDAASELATALANACVREAESAAALAGESGGAAGQSSSSASPQEFYLVPCCLCGGGSSFCIGGFVRLRADNRVPPTDRVASDLLSQWQLQGPLQGASAPLTYIDATAGGPQGVRTPAYVLRVNWIEKYGRMPMLPSRKQPLCGLFGGPRRGPLGGGSASVMGAPQGSGLLRRTSLGPCVEVVVDESKYDEVASCVRDYVQYGSRSNEPWRQGGAGPLASQAQAGGEASAADTHTAARNSPARANVSVSGGPPAGEAPPFSVASLLSLASAQVSARRQQQQQQQQQQGAATTAGGGPKPLPLPGRPLNPRNPFLGYTAILPFLSEEQFNHVRRLQLKALKRAGIVFRGPNLEGTKTPASCASKGRSSHDSDGRSSSGEHETQNAPTATRSHALPTASEKHPTATDHPGGTTAASTLAEATAATATAAAAAATATPAATATAAATAATGVLLAAKPSQGVSKSAPSDAADRGPPMAPKRAAGPSAPKGRRAPVVVPPPLKRLRAAVEQGTGGASTAKGSDAGGSSWASPEKLGAPSENPEPSVGPTTLSATNPVQSEGESSAATQRQLVCRDTLAHAANENSSGEEAADAGATPTDSLACSCAVDALQSAPEGGAEVSNAMHAAAAEAHQ